MADAERPSLLAAREESLVNLSGAWTILRGYVSAHEPGDQIDPAELLAYMDRLRHEARKPLRDAFRAVQGGDRDA